MRTNCYKPMLLALTALCLMAGHTAKAQTYSLITTDTDWRYNQTGTYLGTAWRTAGYDDTVAGWEGPGKMLFGFETTPAEYAPFTFNTPFPDPQNPNTNFRTNFYFRTHFTMPSVPAGYLAGTELITTNAVDDGAVVYINGVEIFRQNMPAGAVNANTFAPTAPAEGWPPTGLTVFFRTNLATNVVVGDNVMEVEVHQNAFTSSDEVFGMTMVAVLPHPIAITTQPANQNLIAGANVTNSVTVTGFSPAYQWYSNSVKVANATNSTFIFPGTPTKEVDVYVIVTNILNSVTSSVAHVSVISDTFPIVLNSAFAGPLSFTDPPATAASNQMYLFFNKLITRNSATNPAIYNIGIFGLTNKLAVSAVGIGTTFIRLTLANGYFVPGTNYTICVGGITGTNLLPMHPNPTCLGISMTHSNTPPAVTNLISAGGTWDFNENNGMDLSGNSLGSAWIATNYVEDLTWGSGSSIFYYDNLGAKSGCNGSASTGISQGQTTIYFRTTFVPPAGVPSSGNLVLSYFVDDGAVYYLNGTEIYRNGMPAGVPSFTTPANVTAPNPPLCVITNIPVNNLIYKGNNVMAVELHQAGGMGDAHAYFGLQVDYQPSYPLLITNTPPVPPKMTTSIANNCINISWTPTVGGLTWGLDSTTDLKDNGSGIVWTQVQNTSPFQVCAPFPGNRKFYILHKR